MSNSVLTAIENRITTNLFDPTRTISDEQITELVRLATKAPTAFNLQNWRFIAVRTPENKEKLRQVASNQTKVTDASVMFIVCGVLPDYETIPARLEPSVQAGFMPEGMLQGWKDFAKMLYDQNPVRSRDEAVRSATLGASTLAFAAQGMGMNSSLLIGFDPDGVSQEFGLRNNEVPVVLLAVGYALSGNWPQKPRRSVSEILEIV